MCEFIVLATNKVSGRLVRLVRLLSTLSEVVKVSSFEIFISWLISNWNLIYRCLIPQRLRLTREFGNKQLFAFENFLSFQNLMSIFCKYILHWSSRQQIFFFFENKRTRQQMRIFCILEWIEYFFIRLSWICIHRCGKGSNNNRKGSNNILLI